MKNLLSCLALLATSAFAQEPQLIAALAQARAQGCGGQPGPRTPLVAVPQLSAAAAQVARGVAPMDAVQGAGYRARRIYHVRMTGVPSAAAVAQAVASRYCKALADPGLTEVGVHQQGRSHWILLAAPLNPPPASASAEVAAQVLRLVNEARSQPRRCGDRSFGAAGPLQLDAQLGEAAARHAAEMARHSYMAHEGRDGSSPDQRITRTGYRWRSVGENVAAGQPSAAEVVRDWVASPVHCANLMNPGFTEMGIAYAVNNGSESGIYWTQTFGRPW